MIEIFQRRRPRMEIDLANQSQRLTVEQVAI